jgi:hypothetical protein
VPARMPWPDPTPGPRLCRGEHHAAPVKRKGMPLWETALREDADAEQRGHSLGVLPPPRGARVQLSDGR